MCHSHVLHLRVGGLCRLVVVQSLLVNHSAAPDGSLEQWSGSADAVHAVGFWNGHRHATSISEVYGIKFAGGVFQPILGIEVFE